MFRDGKNDKCKGFGRETVDFQCAGPDKFDAAHWQPCNIEKLNIQFIQLFSRGWKNDYHIQDHGHWNEGYE